MTILLCLYVAFCTAQNNPIFTGGNGDGHSKAVVLQNGTNIYAGGNGDGHAAFQTARPTVDQLFKGGDGDGWNSLQTIRLNVDTLFNGGNGDGWNSKNSSPMNVDTLFNGGNSDGWFSQQTARPNVDIFFKGGDGDGWASTYRPQGPIPVNFLYFTAQKKGQTASLLNWKTSQEINSNYFNVERSTDAVNFIYIGRVAAAGNSQVPVEYYFTDNYPASGLNYYRLKQVDIDGHFTYTPSRLVRFDGSDAGLVKYFPNPTNGILNIELTASMKKEAKVVNITNTAGIVMNQFKLGINTDQFIQIDLGRYPKGVYFIQVKTETVNSTQRVVLQ